MSIRSTNAMPLATSGKKEYGMEYFLKVCARADATATCEPRFSPGDAAPNSAT